MCDGCAGCRQQSLGRLWVVSNHLSYMGKEHHQPLNISINVAYLGISYLCTISIISAPDQFHHHPWNQGYGAQCCLLMCCRFVAYKYL